MEMSMVNSVGMGARTRADREVGVAPVDVGVEVDGMVFPEDEKEDDGSGELAAAGGGGGDEDEDAGS